MPLKSFLSSCLTVAALVLSSVVAQGDTDDQSMKGMPRSKGKQVIWPHEISNLQPDPKVNWGMLDNGLRYVILSHDEPPGRVSLRLLVQAGSLMETDAQRGLAHFLEHMAFNGTRNFPAAEMVEYFQRLGMAFGADTNAHTWWLETVYKLELPESSDSLLKDAFQLFQDYANGMLLDEKEIDGERGVILAEKRARESIEFRISRDELRFNLPDSLIPYRFAIGEEEVILNAPREEFVSFYNKWYTADRLVLVAVGDITEEQLEPLINEYLGALPENRMPLSAPDLGTIAERGAQARVYREGEASAVSVSITTVRRDQDIVDSAEHRERDIITRVANAIINRRLRILSKQEGAAFVQGAAFSYDWLDFAEYAGIELRCQPDKWNAALEVAETELRRALEYGFTESETREIAARLLNNYEEAVEQANTRKSRDLADALVRSVSDADVFTSPEQDLQLARGVLESISAEKAHAALKDVWSSSTRLIYVSGNVPDEVTNEMALSVYNSSQKNEVAPPEDTELTDFAYQNFGEPGQVVDSTTIEDLEIKQLQFSNNVRVNLKRTDFEANVVRVLMRFGAGDLVMPEELPGLSLIASSIFVGGGLEEHSLDDLERIFAGQSVNVNFGVDSDAFVLSGVTNPKDLHDQLRLMTAYLVAPGYREEAIRQTRNRLPQVYRQLMHTPDGVLQDRVASFLAGGDYRFGFPPLESVMSRTISEVREWLDEPLRRGYLEVSVVGDFDEEEVVAILSETVGALPERENEKPRHAAKRKLEFPGGVGAKVFEYESNIPKAVAMVAWPTADMWDISRTRRLGVLADIITERLRVKIREELGEAYSPYAYNRSSDTFEGYGYAAALITLSPESVAKIAEMTAAIGADLASNGANQDELDRMIAPLLKQLEEWRRNNRYWLSSVLASSQEYPIRLEWSRTMEQDLRSVTLEEINLLAKEYLQAERAVQILVMPRTTESETHRDAASQ